MYKNFAPKNVKKCQGEESRYPARSGKKGQAGEPGQEPIPLDTGYKIINLFFILDVQIFKDNFKWV